MIRNVHTLEARPFPRRASAPRRADTVWCGEVLRACAPATLRVIAALLLEPGDLTSLDSASHAVGTRPARALDLLVARVGDDAQLAARLAHRLSQRAASASHLLDCSPYQVLLLWSARRQVLSRQELGVMLARLACTDDTTLAPLAQRRRHDVELEALRGLPEALLRGPR